MSPTPGQRAADRVLRSGGFSADMLWRQKIKWRQYCLCGTWSGACLGAQVYSFSCPAARLPPNQVLFCWKPASILTIKGHGIYTAPCLMIFMRANPLWGPLQWPKKWICPHQNHYVQVRVNTTSIGDFMYMGPNKQACLAQWFSGGLVICVSRVWIWV